MRHTPLFSGQVIYPNDDVYACVWAIIEKNQKENLARGLLTEYSHNLAFQAAGWPYEVAETYAVFDRRINGLMQDDKLATLNDKGELSRTHTISSREYAAWIKEPDVIIHSFEEMDDGRNGSRYRGEISFKRLLSVNLLRSSQFDDTYYFDRLAALKYANA